MQKTKKEHTTFTTYWLCSDALLAELELTSEILSEGDTEPPKVCYLLERDNKDKLDSAAAQSSVLQHKNLITPETKKVQPAVSIQYHGEDADSIYSKVPTPQPLVSSSSSTSAAQQLDDLLAGLGSVQSKPSYGTEGPGEPSSGEQNAPDTLDSMLEGLTQGLQDLGVAAVPKGNCASCHKPIAGKVVTALGQTWHPEHFTCAHCKKEMGARPFFERDSKAYCQEDYHQLFSPRCAYCTAPIQEKVLTAMDQTWHPEHFFCAHCGKMFGNEGFHEKDGKPYCKRDYLTLFSLKCKGCDRPVMDQYLSALNAVWHPECFVCGDCFCSFSNGAFFELDGQPYCELHFHHHQGTVCHGCGKPIIGRCVSAMGHRFHPEHFVCAFCLTQLHNGIFQEQNDKAYCNPCFNKLFF
ncbi:leupaxin isoform X1 [Eublepharis macularius]|uniref:Leupaxin isoform X1 n=1 Tax=Eublepharis macularius TaxID=481883 RepID=A0AA97IY17_EUBMA|nr:leupaxin isoform X1 [Eublepharis macularius]